MQRLRQHAVPHRLDHLDHAGDSGGGLGVADVGLQRAEPERPALGTVLAVGGEQGLRLDRVTQAGPGAVRLDHVHVRGGEPGVRQRLPDHPLLRGAVRRRQAVGRAVLVDGRAADQREHLVPVAPGVREPLQEHQADALAPAGAVRRGGERLAASVRGEPALPGELDERLRGGEHGRAAGQRHVDLAVAQRLRRQVQRHQRGRARRVDGDRRAFEAQRVGHPAGGDAAGDPGDLVALQLPGVLLEPHGVVVRDHAGVDADVAAAQRGRVDAGLLEGLPGGLQQQPLLRVHRHRLARRDPEEGRVEAGGGVQERAVAGVGLADLVGVGVEQVLQVPFAVLGEAGDRVHAVGHQPPQLLGAVRPAGEPAAHGHDRDRVVVQRRTDRHGRGGDRLLTARQFVPQVPGEHGRGGVVEDQGGRQAQTGGRAQPVAQLDHGQRVEADLLEGPVLLDALRVRVAEHRRGRGADQVQQQAELLGLRESGQPLCERVGAGQRATRRGGPPGLADQTAQQRGDRLGGGPRAQAREVEVGGHQGRRRTEQTPVEERHAGLGGEPAHAVPGVPPQGGVVQVRGHLTGVGPVAPGQRDGRQATGPALLRDGVQEGVGRRVVALARVAEGARGRGEEHERGQVEVRGQLVQVEDRVDLGTEDRLQPLGGERREDAVVQHPRRVHHPG